MFNNDAFSTDSFSNQSWDGLGSIFDGSITVGIQLAALLSGEKDAQAIASSFILGSLYNHESVAQVIGDAELGIQILHGTGSVAISDSTASILFSHSRDVAISADLNSFSEAHLGINLSQTQHRFVAKQGESGLDIWLHTDQDRVFVATVGTSLDIVQSQYGSSVSDVLAGITFQKTVTSNFSTEANMGAGFLAGIILDLQSDRSKTTEDVISFTTNYGLTQSSIKSINAFVEESIRQGVVNERTVTKIGTILLDSAYGHTNEVRSIAFSELDVHIAYGVDLLGGLLEYVEADFGTIQSITQDSFGTTITFSSGEQTIKIRFENRSWVIDYRESTKKVRPPHRVEPLSSRKSVVVVPKDNRTIYINRTIEDDNQ